MRLLIPFLSAMICAGCTSTDPGTKDPETKPPPAASDEGKRAYSPERAAALAQDALDQFAKDWQDAVASETGGQRVWLKNGAQAGGATDTALWIALLAPETGARPEREVVEWYLARDEAAEKAVDSDPARKAQRNGRPLYALRRRVWRLGDDERATHALEQRAAGGLPIAVKPGDDAKTEAGADRPPMVLLGDKVVATALLSWNIEVYDPDPKDPYIGRYFELENSKIFPESSMPVGAGASPRALPRKLRATAVLPDPDAADGMQRHWREAVRIAR